MPLSSYRSITYEVVDEGPHGRVPLAEISFTTRPVSTGV